jgi:hypothetical protein
MRQAVQQAMHVVQREPGKQQQRNVGKLNTAAEGKVQGGNDTDGNGRERSMVGRYKEPTIEMSTRALR